MSTNQSIKNPNVSTLGAVNAFSCNIWVHDYARHIHFIQAATKSVGAAAPSTEVCNDTVDPSTQAEVRFGGNAILCRTSVGINGGYTSCAASR